MGVEEQRALRELKIKNLANSKKIVDLFNLAYQEAHVDNTEENRIIIARVFKTEKRIEEYLIKKIQMTNRPLSRPNLRWKVKLLLERFDERERALIAVELLDRIKSDISIPCKIRLAHHTNRILGLKFSVQKTEQSMSNSTLSMSPILRDLDQDELVRVLTRIAKEWNNHHDMEMPPVSDRGIWTIYYNIDQNKTGYDRERAFQESMDIMRNVTNRFKNVERVENKMERYQAHMKNVDYFGKEVTRNYADEIPCKKGCSACCHILVASNGFEIEVLSNALQKRGVTDEIKAKLEAQAAHNDPDKYLATIPYKTRGCVFLSDQGECTVYDRRPIACRSYFVKTPKELCNSEDGKIRRVAGLVSFEVEVYATLMVLTYGVADLAPGLLDRIKQLQ